jgi:hypothetical protein
MGLINLPHRASTVTLAPDCQLSCNDPNMDQNLIHLLRGALTKKTCSPVLLIQWYQSVLAYECT